MTSFARNRGLSLLQQPHCSAARAESHSFIHSLLLKLTYRSRTPDSSGYTIQTSRNLRTVFIQCSCNEVFITQSLSWQLSVMRASSQIVVLRCCGLWRKEFMECVIWIVQSLAEQPVVGLVQQLLKIRKIRRAVATTFTTSQERVDSLEVRRRSEASPRGRGVHQHCTCIYSYLLTVLSIESWSK